MIYGIQKPEEYDLATIIIQWSIKEVSYGSNEEPTHHLVGYVISEGAGRTTSAIQSFDKEKMMITTSSGRLYKLKDKPGNNSDADYVWSFWKSHNTAKNEKNEKNEKM